MCLIINKPKDVNFDSDFIKGVYERNQDGIGIMYAENNSLYINRYLPKDYADVQKFWDENIAQRECVVHFRLKTHGHIDLRNCHPYQVISAEEGYPLYLVHNGILSTGNSKDPQFSDTHWFIQDYLRPMLLKNPTFFLTEAFAEIIGDFIGSGNKFILMDAYGNQVVINKDRGVQHEGAWLSNTYAWDTRGTEHDYTKSFKGGGYGGAYGYGYNAGSVYAGRNSLNEYEEDLYEAYGFSPARPKPEAQTETVDEFNEEEQFCIALFDVLDDMGLKHDGFITWENAEDYFQAAGSDLAWGIIDAIAYGCYTQQGVVDELTYFSKVMS